jgi:hypothetical protein
MSHLEGLQRRDIVQFLKESTTQHVAWNTGDLYESQQNALASMSMWKDVVTTVPHTADAAGL